MAREANLSKFKSEILNSQEHQFALLRNDINKTCSELRNDIDKMRVELRHQIHMASADLRLDLKQDIHKLMADFYTVKYDVFKYSIGTLVSMSVGIGVIHIFATKQ